MLDSPRIFCKLVLGKGDVSFSLRIVQLVSLGMQGKYNFASEVKRADLNDGQPYVKPESQMRVHQNMNTSCRYAQIMRSEQIQKALSSMAVENSLMKAIRQIGPYLIPLLV